MRPANTTQRTPASAQRRATSPGAFPRVVVRSTLPSPVTDHVVAARGRSRSRSRTSGRAGQQLRAERRERRPSPPAAPAPGSVRIRRQLCQAEESCFELARVFRRGALLRREDSAPASSRGTPTSHATRVGPEARRAPPAGRRRRRRWPFRRERPAARARLTDGTDQLTESATRALRKDRAVADRADRLRGLDQRPSRRGEKPAPRRAPPERV